MNNKSPLLIYYNKDIMINLFMYLPVQDIIKMSRLCKDLHNKEVFNNDSLWLNLLHRDCKLSFGNITQCKKYGTEYSNVNNNSFKKYYEYIYIMLKMYPNTPENLKYFITTMSKKFPETKNLQFKIGG